MEDLKPFLQAEIEKLAFCTVKLDESLLKAKVLDSITLVDLAVSIEQKTGVQIPFADVNEENFETINKIEKYLNKREASNQ